MKNRISQLLTELGRKYRINRKYKDYIFRMVFRNKKDLLALYNAINGTDYTDPANLEMRTLEDAVYLGYKNDMSFMISNTLNLYEHQSSSNPNMPLRGLFYFSKMYKAYVEEKKYDIYGSTQIPLPVPRYFVFYNGTKELPDKTELKLSDAFGTEGMEEAALECRATVLNINLGHNVELMEKCRRLEEYAYFVATVRLYQAQGNSLGEALEHAMDECIEKDKIADILRKNRAEVKDMFLTDYSEKKYRKFMQEAARREGLEEGVAIGERRLNELHRRLLYEGRLEDLKRSIDDSAYQQELIKEYKIG